jgi:predicted O-methyltransferase YrrM
MSTLLFGRYLEEKGGRLTSIDIDAEHVTFARRETVGLPVDVVQSDSVVWLRDYRGQPFSGIYLDSQDTYCQGFAEHALAEVIAAIPHLLPTAPILFDDTFRKGTGWEGKGEKAVPWLLDRDWKIIRSDWQTLLVR